MITPAISVLSAVEGLSVATSGLEPAVPSITVGILVGLFAVQSRGTAGVAVVFGPILLLWFTAIAGLGLAEIFRHPEGLRVLAALPASAPFQSRPAAGLEERAQGPRPGVRSTNGETASMDVQTFDTLIHVAGGTVVLLFGRRLFWLTVAVSGFVLASALAPAAVGPAPRWVILGVSLGLGLVGAVLSVYLQYVAVALAGFAVGAYAAVVAQTAAGTGSALVPWIAGGFGAVLCVLLLEPALVALSALAGASAVVATLPLSPAGRLVGFVALAAGGVLFQTAALRPKPDSARAAG